MYTHPSQHFIPHGSLSQQPHQYSHPSLPNEQYSYGQPPPVHYDVPALNQQPQKEEKSNPPSSSVIDIDDDDSDSDYDVGGKRSKMTKRKSKASRAAEKNTSKAVGRHQDEVRTLFKCENGTWYCPICSRSVSPRAGRMKTHFEKCRMLAEYKITKDTDSISRTDSCRDMNNPVSEESSSTESTPRPNANVKTTVKNHKKTGGKNHGGRLKSDVWSHYDERQGLFYCKKCSKRVSSKAHRLASHLATSCINSPAFIAAELRKVGLRASNESSMKESQEIRQQFELRNGEWFCQKCSKLVSSSIEKMKKHLELWCGINLGGSSGISNADGSTRSLSTTTTVNSSKREMTSMLNIQLGKFIFRSNLPFNVVEDPELIKFVNMLSKNGRGNYTPPCIDDVSGPILKEVYNEIQQRMSKDIENKCVTLLQYGWSNIQKEKRNGISQSTSREENNHSRAIIHCLHNGKSSFFLNVIEVAEEDITPQMAHMTCLKLLESSMESATQMYNCKLSGILTDMTMRDTIQSCHPTLHVYSSYKELFHDLGQELLKLEINNAVVKVQEYFSTMLSDNVNIPALDGVNIQSPNGDKDWKNQLDNLKSFYTNFQKYIEVMSTFHVPLDIKAILEDQDLYVQVEQLVFVLTPLAEAFKKLKNDTSTIADAIHLWLTLLNDENISASHKERIREAFSDAVTPMAIAAYLLHPVYRGQHMDLEVQEVGRIFLLERDPMFVVFQSALEREDPSYFPTSLLNPIVAKQMTPAVWWEDAGKWPRIPPGLTETAVSLMILPASNMMSEFFPTIMNMVSSQKKSLGWEKTLQLCNTYFDLQKK